MSRALAAVVVLVVLAVAAGGCLDDAPPSLGDEALAWVEEIVYRPDGSLRPRVPGTDGHEDTARWLAEQLTAPGWDVRIDTFTGSGYLSLPPGSVAPYQSPPRCPASDHDELAQLTFHNVYARLAAPEPVGHVVLAAHWDAKEDANRDSDLGKRDHAVPGANDGASGVGLLLALQDRIAALALPYEVTIALFDGEDGFEDCHPLAGSTWAAQRRAFGAIDRFILLDMVGDADARFPREKASALADPALVALVWGKAPAHGLAENFIQDERAITDDHTPFLEVGIPAIDIVDAGRATTFPPYWHTTHDTPDKLSAAMLGRMGALMLDVLGDPAMTDWPTT